MKTRLLMVGLGAMLMAGLLSGCGAKEDATTTDPAAAPSTAPAMNGAPAKKKSGPPIPSL